MVTRASHEHKEQFFTLRLSDSERSMQRTAAKALGLTESEFVRSAVAEKIQRIITDRSATRVEDGK